MRLRRNANSMRLPAMLADRDRPGSMICSARHVGGCRDFLPAWLSSLLVGLCYFYERAVSREISLKFMSAGASSI